MPASLTRTCPACGQERATPADFRDPGERGPGRPPVHCRSCREKSPALQEKQALSVARRPGRRAVVAKCLARTPQQVAADRQRSHPSGVKRCPPVAGCGRELPISAFREAPHYRDGLAGICQECAADHALIRSLR